MRCITRLLTASALCAFSLTLSAQNAIQSKANSKDSTDKVGTSEGYLSRKALEKSFSELDSTARLRPSLTTGSIEALLNTPAVMERDPSERVLDALKNDQRQSIEESAAFFAHHSAALGLNIEHPAAVKALELLGAPYRWGGIDEDDGVDCSGFIIVAFEEAGFSKLPRTAAQMANSLPKIGIHQLTPGDLVFFNTRGPMYSHVGIYLGKNLFAHAPRSGARARIDDMTKPYWLERFNGARSAPITAQQANAHIQRTQYTPKSGR